MKFFKYDERYIFFASIIKLIWTIFVIIRPLYCLKLENYIKIIFIGFLILLKAKLMNDKIINWVSFRIVFKNNNLLLP